MGRGQQSSVEESRFVDGSEFKRGRRRAQKLPDAPPSEPAVKPAGELGVDYEALPFVDVLGGKYKNVLAAQVEAGAAGTDPERAQEFVERLLLAEQNLRELIERHDMVIDGRVLAAHREIWQCLERGI